MSCTQLDKQYNDQQNTVDITKKALLSAGATNIATVGALGVAKRKEINTRANLNNAKTLFQRAGGQNKLNEAKSVAQEAAEKAKAAQSKLNEASEAADTASKEFKEANDAYQVAKAEMDVSDETLAEDQALLTTAEADAAADAVAEGTADAFATAATAIAAGELELNPIADAAEVAADIAAASATTAAAAAATTAAAAAAAEAVAATEEAGATAEYATTNKAFQEASEALKTAQNAKSEAATALQKTLSEGKETASKYNSLNSLTSNIENLEDSLTKASKFFGNAVAAQAAAASALAVAKIAEGKASEDLKTLKDEKKEENCLDDTKTKSSTALSRSKKAAISRPSQLSNLIGSPDISHENSSFLRDINIEDNSSYLELKREELNSLATKEVKRDPKAYLYHMKLITYLTNKFISTSNSQEGLININYYPLHGYYASSSAHSKIFPHAKLKNKETGTTIGKEHNFHVLSFGSKSDKITLRNNTKYISSHLGDGNNIFSGSNNNDAAIALAGSDTLSGLKGDDLLDGGQGRDLIKGGKGKDLIAGGGGNDVMRSGAGNDFAYGGYGSDEISGNSSDDLIVGEEGNDILFGNQGDDILLGGEGSDELKGGRGNDHLSGGKGSDKFHLKTIEGSQTIADFNSNENDKLLVAEKDRNRLTIKSQPSTETHSIFTITVGSSINEIQANPEINLDTILGSIETF